MKNLSSYPRLIRLAWLVFLLISPCHADGLSSLIKINPSPNRLASPLVVGYIDFPPLYETINRQPQGILVDVSSEVFDRLDVISKSLPMPTKRLFSSLKTGLVQLWCGIRIEELQPYVWTGTVPLHQLTLNLYSVTPQQEITQLHQLEGKSVILLMGYKYGGWGDFIRGKQNKIKYIEVKSHADAVRLLKTRRFDFLLNYQAPMNAELAESAIANISFHTVDQLDIVFNVSKKTKDGQALLRKLEQTLSQLIQEGKVTLQ